MLRFSTIKKYHFVFFFLFFSFFLSYSSFLFPCSGKRQGKNRVGEGERTRSFLNLPPSHFLLLVGWSKETSFSLPLQCFTKSMPVRGDWWKQIFKSRPVSVYVRSFMHFLSVAGPNFPRGQKCANKSQPVRTACSLIIKRLSCGTLIFISIDFFIFSWTLLVRHRQWRAVNNLN